jgi:DNA invertase Pin-like site-specific DNA recombinase
MKRATTPCIGIYARYSSDLQSVSSIEDQFRVCTEKAAAESWRVAGEYSDAGLSGASLMRPGIQALLADALAGKFDILLAEALDRISRDQEDIAGIYKRMAFAGVKIVTLSEGEISWLHIGLKGTMNAMFLKDLADKTRRGLRGRVELGKSGGGIAYGYDVVKRFDTDGNAQRGDRIVNAMQATIVRRVFQEYGLRNLSPRAIASQLNVEGIPSPSGKGWSQSTLNGNRRRGTGILNNELYIGRLVWNRNASSRIRKPGGASRGSTTKASGSFKSFLTCASSPKNYGTAPKPGKLIWTQESPAFGKRTGRDTFSPVSSSAVSAAADSRRSTRPTMGAQPPRTKAKVFVPTAKPSPEKYWNPPCFPPCRPIYCVMIYSRRSARSTRSISIR